MDGILQTIQKTYEILQNRLTFGSFSFSLFAVMISFAAIGIAGRFFGGLFSK